MTTEKIVMRRRERGGIFYAILTHGLRASLGQSIHGRGATHYGRERKRRERLRHNLLG